MNENNKKDNRKYIVGGITIATICLGIGFVIGREHEMRFWTKIFKEAYDNGSTKLYYNKFDGRYSIEYILNCVGEVSH